jgi:lipopolysaccharide/colanic/teichoic acid biosynthesis glycosyltransferase
VKRVFDIFCSLIISFIALPIIFLLIIISKITIGSPIFFKQERAGLNGKIFYIIKFRTMKSLKDENGKLLPDNERLTEFGRFLRSTSLDEIPELINVIKGDMSLVGPRPLLKEYLDLYSPVQARRHDVRPGLTGWAQINGRNNLTWNEKFEKDIWYVDNQSMFMDIKILILTIKKIITKEGISAKNNEFMPPFTGNNDEAK